MNNCAICGPVLGVWLSLVAAKNAPVGVAQTLCGLSPVFILPFVPFFMEGVAGVDELNLGDGIHPTPEGHRILASNVAPALEELLASLD